MGEARVVPVRLAEDLLTALDERAQAESRSRSAVIRAALTAYLREPALRMSPADQRRIAQISEQFGLERLELFGSWARGDARHDSDVDLLYTLKPGVRLGWRVEDLADELAAALGHRVDLVSRKALHPQMRDAVLAEVELLYAA